MSQQNKRQQQQQQLQEAQRRWFMVQQKEEESRPVDTKTLPLFPELELKENPEESIKNRHSSR